MAKSGKERRRALP